MFKHLISLALLIPASLCASTLYTVQLGSQDFVQFTLPAFQSAGFITSFDTAITTYATPISQVVFDLSGAANCPLFTGLGTTKACVEVDHVGAQFGSLINLVSPGLYQSSPGNSPGITSLQFSNASAVPEPATFALLGGALIAGLVARKRFAR